MRCYRCAGPRSEPLLVQSSLQAICSKFRELVDNIQAAAADRLVPLLYRRSTMATRFLLTNGPGGRISPNSGPADSKYLSQRSMADGGNKAVLRSSEAKRLSVC